MLLQNQPKADTMQMQLIRARNAQQLLPTHALMTNAAEQMESQRRELLAAEGNMAEAAGKLPVAEQQLQAALLHQDKADAMLQQIRLLEDMIPALKELGKQQKEQKQLQSDILVLTAESRQADEVYSAAKESYYLCQAGLLASTLETGKPCPVCGAVEHPSPAKLSETAVPREILDAAEKKRREAEDKLSDASGKLTAVTVKIAAAKERLRTLALSEEETERSLKEKIATLNSSAKQLRDAIELSRKTLHDLQLKFKENEAKVQSVRGQMTDTAQKRTQYQQLFEKALTEYGFHNAEDFKTAVLPEAAMARLEQAIRQHNERKQSLKDQVEKLTEKLEGKEPADLSALKSKQEELDKAQNQADADEKNIAGKVNLHEGIYKEISNACRQRKRKEEHWAVVRDLFDCCSGKSGGSRRAKLTFEAYVQQYYFKQIVAAANKRLTVLTDGMFTLRCKEEAADRVHQSGLDLDVLDRSTGQWRDVSTLSGGESFLASLALALGLSDVVQGQSGAIRMEAMFIDEGFGTLDENALRNSLRVLNDLADGKRLVGIISHVQDLEEKIERQIVVSKTLRGSEISIIGS